MTRPDYIPPTPLTAEQLDAMAARCEGDNPLGTLSAWAMTLRAEAAHVRAHGPRGSSYDPRAVGR